MGVVDKVFGYFINVGCGGDNVKVICSMEFVNVYLIVNVVCI